MLSATRARPAPARRAGRLVAWSWAMLLLAPVGLLLAVAFSQLVAGGLRERPQLVVDAVGLVVLAAPQLVGAALAVVALRRASSRAAWIALTANLIVLGLPFFLAAGGGNVVNVTSMAVLSALAVRFSRAA